ncbi:hypothetical protein HPP92_002910 [Vanilla planifolia]|uniref:Arf-GAP domain-containing protein n=1 Tax=Vanilla planifolia TaxID=51239 RepID=A0A835VEY3_VANPL|nr:hypothetical protein HPP92_002910 [Vanilla planifolia]
MNSKRLEERNEKVIRGLMKLPPNRSREFTHRVKSVSMAKFTTQEVEALENGGNQRARDIFLKEWDMHTMRFPDNSYPDKIREFIKKVYVDKKYAGGISSDKPPRDPQDQKAHEERRASSYHSYSQSPPYDHQYEDRRYGKPKKYAD